MDKDKLQIAIYRIDKDSELFPENGTRLSILESQAKSKGYSLQNLKQKVENFEIKIFYKKSPSEPKWKKFFESVIDDDQDILKNNQSWSESFIMFLLNTKTENLYAVTGGSGFYVAQDFIDDNFGVDILSRLIKKEDKILKSVKEKSVVGGILGTTKYFRNNYNLSENDSFGKIYQELKANLNKDALQSHFGFSIEELKKDSTCIAQTSFKINKSINFKQIFQIISGCEYILENPDKDPNLDPVVINSVVKILKKKDKTLIQKLEDELFKQLWERYSDRNVNIDFDLCHKDFEKYLTASRYVVAKGNSTKNFFGDFEFKDEYQLNTIDKLFDALQKLDDKPTTKNDFQNIIKSLSIYSFNDEDEEKYTTKGSILAHIFGDVPLDDKVYFLIDSNWYKIKNSFIKDLNTSCENFIKNNFNEDLNKRWDVALWKDENNYNKAYIGEPNTIVLDKIIPENIEPCDILRWDDKNLYFHHIKAGFGNTMRDLCSQVFVAANRLLPDKLTTRDYINKIYDHLLKKKGSSDEYFNSVGKQTDKITRDNFIKLFTEKKFIFVLSIRDTSKTSERSMKNDISQFHSNIAKFSLQELVKGMKSIEVGFQFGQIFK